MTIAQHIRQMIERDGWYVVHIRRDPAHPCSNCTGLHGGEGREPNPRCPVCLGLGNRVLLRPIKVRSSSPARPDYNDLEETEVGIIGALYTLYYVLPETAPDAGDLLVEVTWDVPTTQVPARGQVLVVQKVFQANYVEPKRGEAGELAYYRVASQAIDLDKVWLGQQLLQRPTA